MRVQTNVKFALIQTYRLTQFLSIYSDFLAFYGSYSNRVLHIELFPQFVS